MVSNTSSQDNAKRQDSRNQNGPNQSGRAEDGQFEKGSPSASEAGKKGGQARRKDDDRQPSGQ